MALPPGLPEGPARQTMRWLVRPIALLEESRRRYGDAFSVNFLGFQSPLVMVSHPEVVKALYTERAHGLPPGRELSLRPIVGARSVLLLEGPQHLSRRKLMLPSFHGERMRAYQPIMREAAAREVETWPAETPFAVHPSMQAITLEVILRAVFGVADSGRRTQLAGHLRELLRLTASPGLQMVVLLSRRFNGPDPLARLDTLTAEIDDILLAEIADRRADPVQTAERDDICSLLALARFEDGELMDRREIRDQLMTLLVAGHETTATALAWTLDLLVHHPEALRRLRAEVDAGEDTYLRAVIAESLRLRPVVPLAGRRLASDLRVDGVDLPAGTDVTPAIWLTHTRGDLYPEPYAFRPERFLNGAPQTYAWIPFGGGIRRCLGAAFAEMEMRVVLAEIVRRRELRPADKKAERVARRNVTFSPRNGTRVVAAPRT
jgi:cytochrome P450 family 135